MLQRLFEAPPRRVLGDSTAKCMSQRHTQACFEVVELVTGSHMSVVQQTRSPSMASDADQIRQHLRVSSTG